MALSLLVTEVTEIHRGTYCVAGWDKKGARMVRPLPDGIYWTREQLDTRNIAPGVTITVVPNRIRVRSGYPHRTEDVPIDLTPIEMIGAAQVDWFCKGAPPVAVTLAEAFSRHLCHSAMWRMHRRGVYVPVGILVGSLYGLRLSSHRISFMDDTERLRALIQDPEARYSLPVTSRSLREIWRTEGISAVRRALPARTELHLRVGLARPRNAQCYAMLNGVLW